MGSWTSLEIKGYPLLSTKNSVDAGLLAILFCEDDLSIAVEEDEDNSEEVIYLVSCPIQVAIDRLEIYGYDLISSKLGFETVKLNMIEEYVGLRESMNSLDDDYWEVRYKAIKECTYEKLLEGVREIIQKGYYTEGDEIERSKYNTELIFFRNQFEDLLTLLDFDDFLHFLRLILEAFIDDDEALIYQDYTAILQGGWVDEKLIDWEEKYTRILLLTEGKSDNEYISKSINLLYPHLFHIYSFLDFQGAKAAGSVGQLLNLSKSLIGARIKERVIIIFDNDTAGREGYNQLRKLVIPLNFKILHYPNLDFFKLYPAIGPSGYSKLDINGLACSLEMYFGKDVLTDDNGELIPIQWKGYNARMQSYQGEILTKGDVQKSFNRKLITDTPIDFTMWQEMDELLKTIFKAFIE